MAPVERVAAYSQTNYDRVQAALASYGSSLLYVAGFSESEVELPLLTALSLRRFISLYLSLVLDVLLIILFALSSVLVYSLLLLNVEGRTFEVAVRRMLGSGRKGVVVLLLMQAAAYGVPSWIFGLLIGQAIAAGLLSGFAKLASIPVPLELTPSAIGAATALAIAIPAISSIGPIRGALGKSIREALDPDRPKAPAVQVTLTRSNAGTVSWTMVIVGFGVFAFGEWMHKAVCCVDLALMVLGVHRLHCLLCAFSTLALRRLYGLLPDSTGHAIAEPVALLQRVPRHSGGPASGLGAAWAQSGAYPA